MALTTSEEYTWFFRGEYPSVLRTARMILQDKQAAEDAAQEAFVRLYRHWKKVSQYDKPEAWVRRVAIRIAVKALRKERIQSAFQADHEPGHLDSNYDIDLMKAIAQLPGMQRAAIVLFYLEDRPVSELAPMLDCSEATAKVHLHRGRKRLAILLGEEAVGEVALDVS